MQTTRVIGLIGEIAAGKSTATEYIKEKYGAVTFRFSDMLRDVARRMYLKEDRHNLQLLSTVLRQNFSEDIMSKVIARDVAQAQHPIIITEGVRRPSDITYLKELPGFYLIALTASEHTRYERLKQRNENPDDATKTWEQFMADGAQESEQKVKELMAQADVTIDNTGDKENLFQHIDAAMKKILAV